MSTHSRKHSDSFVLFTLAFADYLRQSDQTYLVDFVCLSIVKKLQVMRCLGEDAIIGNAFLNKYLLTGTLITLKQSSPRGNEEWKFSCIVSSN